MVLGWKFSQKYPVNAGVSQGSILDLILFLLYINDLPDDDICNIAIYADVATLYSKCDQGYVATTRDARWTWIWSRRHCVLGQDVSCWF